MDYTEVDPKAVAEALYAEKAREALWEAYTLGLDADALAWCADVAAVTGSGDDGEAVAELAAEARARAKDAAARATTLTKRVKAKAEKAGITTGHDKARTEWLALYVVAVEREHAQHEALVVIAEESGDDEQALQHRLGMLRCEAAHEIALR